MARKARISGRTGRQKAGERPAALTRAITQEIHAVDPNVLVYNDRTMHDRLYDSLARQRFAATMLGAFAAFALVLAAVGVYGVMSYLVSQGTHDLGVRVALGAQPADILGWVLRQAMELAALGIAGGLAGGLALSHVMTSLLFGISPTDPATFSAVAIILTGAALLASYLPARRAMKVDPLIALRYE
jgi:ABC-type antimicrobial peptide transport system permease subunit